MVIVTQQAQYSLRLLLSHLDRYCIPLGIRLPAWSMSYDIFISLTYGLAGKPKNPVAVDVHALSLQLSLDTNKKGEREEEDRFLQQQPVGVANHHQLAPACSLGTIYMLTSESQILFSP